MWWRPAHDMDRYSTYTDAVLRANNLGPISLKSASASGESALQVAENSVLTVGISGLVGNFGFCACVFCITKDSVLIA